MLRSSPSLPALFSLILAPFLLVGCSGPSSNRGGGAGADGKPQPAVETAGFQKTAARGKREGTIVDAAFAEPKTFNSVIVKETSSGTVLAPIFDGLVTRNLKTLEIEPALAESYKPSADGRTWTFTLRPGLKWSDGQPCTADDVVFTLDVIYDPKVDTTIRELLKVDGKPWSYKKLDDRTVQIDLPTPFGPFLDTVASFPVLPKHKLEAAWKAGKFNSTWGIDTPPAEIVGTGPFVLAKYAPGESITFKRNPTYWKLAADETQLPFLDGGVTMIVPDLNTVILKFKSKETDLTGLRPEDWNDIKQGEAGGDYKALDLGPEWGFTYLSFNQNPRAANLAPYKRDWFSKKEFRQAVSYALNRDSMIQTVLRGLGQPLWSPVSAANKVFYDPNVKQYPYDPAKAKQMLASLGFADRKGTGVLEDSAGHPLEFTLMTNTGNNIRIALCNIIQEDLKQIGIKVNFTPVEFNALVTRLDNSYDWEAMLLGFTGGPEPHLGKSIWTTPGIHHLWNPKQTTPATPWEARIDQIFSEAAKLTDTTQRKKLYDEWQEIVAEQQPLIFLTTPKALASVRNRLVNMEPTALGLRWNIYEISTQ